MSHDHPHSHSHASDSPEQLGPQPSSVLFFDAFSGASGDMTISALLDLGAPRCALEKALSGLPLDGYRLEYGHRHRSGIDAGSFEVVVDGPQPERTWHQIHQMLLQSQCEPRVQQLAIAIFSKLAEAEAKVHRAPIEQVHFHEVGGVDAIVDIVGAAALICALAPSEIVCTPLPLGHGMVQARHGVLPLPAPAALECLKGVPTYGVPVEAELVTPTGAAILSTIAHRFESWPSIAPERVGYGSGTKEFPHRPNLLRVVLGKPTEQQTEEGSHVVIECNVDDISGELAGHVLQRLMQAGALDVWAAPVTGKKGRPALIIGAIAEHGHEQAVAQTMLRETTTIGVRYRKVTRLVRPREIVLVQTQYGEVPLKVSSGPFGPAQAKPEFDA